MAAWLVVIALGLFIALLAYKGKKTLHERLHPEIYCSDLFPEERFPATDEAGFRKKCGQGYEAMKGASLVICGITRDDAETLPLTIRRIEKTGALFADYRVVIFENDSADRTPELLRAWEAQNGRVTILSESLRGLPLFSGSRFERLAHCRNRCLDHIRRNRELDGHGYVMVLDMDLAGGWSLDGIASTFAETGWDAVASNSIGYHFLRRTYYDTLALKPAAVLNRSWLRRLIGEGWQLRRGAPLIRVQSAFGGLAIYRRAPLLLRQYEGSRDGKPVCEHDSLNGDGRMRFFLNPGQITVTGTQESRGSGAASPWKRELRRLFRNW